MVRRSLLLLLALIGQGCASSRPEPPSEGGTTAAEEAAMDRVLGRDDVLGGVRNHACETVPLAQAVRAYVDELAALDFTGCPPAFVAAFDRHREAWAASIEFFEAYRDLRGEMHDLFERIRASSDEARRRLEALEAEIWGTWAEVETARQQP